MKNRLKMTLGLSMACAAINVSANALQNPTPHIWHTITVAEGNWTGRLQMINEVDKAWFVLPDGVTKVNAVQINPNAPQKVGFVVDFSQKPDFDMAYTVTLVKNDKASSPNMTSKSCIFIVTATGPGQPDIKIHSFNGAACTWKAAEHGEDFNAA